MFKRLLFLPFMILLFAVGILLSQHGFKRIEDLRKIERIPRSAIAALIPGEANVSGTTEVHQKTLRGPDSGAATLYYSYTIEEQKRDADGDTKWETVHSETQFVPFILRDTSGTLLVMPAGQGTVSLAQKHQRTQNNRRYTERRIDPGVTVFAMGLAKTGPAQTTLHFEGPGNYVPILSVRTEEKERGSVGLTSLLLTVGGLVFLSLAIYAFTRVAGIHQTIAYLLLVAIAIMLTMLHQSRSMVRNDLRAAFERLEHERSTRKQAIAHILTQNNIAWNGDWANLDTTIEQAGQHLPPPARVALSTHRINLTRAILRAERIRDGFPERLIAKSMGITKPAMLQLTEAETQQLRAWEQAFVPSRISRIAAAILIAIGLVGAFLLGGLGLNRIKTKRWIENIPTVKIGSVVYGINEITGEAILPESATPLVGPLSNKHCLAYHYVVKEKRRSGKKTEWVTITNEKQQIPFLCKDAEGAISVIPDDAEIIMKTRSRRRKGRLQYLEHCLPVGTSTYVLGSATVHPETHDSLILHKGDDSKLPFIISDYSANELIAKKAAVGFLLLNFGFNFFMLAGFSLAGYKGGFGAVAYLTAALTPLLYLVLFMIATLYNDLIFLQRRCEAMWANIDVALKKRFDLLPQLVNTAKAYLTHEQSLQQHLAELRTSGTSSTPEQAGAMVASEQAVRNALIGAVEAYPDLKGNETMSDLMRRMRDLEDDVAFMREGYNHAVETYNTRMARLPEILLAKLFRFVPRNFFHTDDRTTVRIN